MTKPRILVVDDASWREDFCLVLNDLGFDALQATCGTEFAERAPNSDIIILDIEMPMTPNGRKISTAGLDVLLELQRQYPSHPAIQNPIIRSMWNREVFNETPLRHATIAVEHWIPRITPLAELLDLIRNIVDTKGN
jgi:CheY-like chemotaxis protein